MLTSKLAALRQLNPKQLNRLIGFFSKINPTGLQLQKFFGASDLVNLMLDCPDLSRVDRDAFASLLSMQQLEDLWSPVEEYTTRIMKRSELRNWGFTQLHADKLAAELHNHSSLLLPTGVKIELEKDLKSTWDELMLWLKDEIGALGYTLKEYFNPNTLSFLPGCEYTGELRLSAVDLDLVSFGQPSVFCPQQIRSYRPTWPGLEVVSLLALNPKVCIALGNKIIPNILVAGLSCGFDLLPLFSCGNNQVLVYGYHSVNNFYRSSVVAFR